MIIHSNYRIQEFSDYFECPIGLKQGCLASPKLFPLFINEWAVMMNDDVNIKGVQIMPNEISIWLLMFTDDVALLAETVQNLQYQLNVT